MAVLDLYFLPTDYFTPLSSHSLDNANSKEPIWLNGWYNSCCVQEEQNRRRFRSSERSRRGRKAEEGAKLSSGEKSTQMQETIYVRLQEEEDASLASNTNQQKLLQHDDKALVALLKVCGRKNDLDTGSKLHAAIVRMGLLEKNVFVGTSLVSMYAKCGLLAKAQEVFDKLPFRDVVTWNGLIVGYVEHELSEQALKCFEQMQCDGVPPNFITFACILKACGSLGAVDKGQEVHARIVREGFLNQFIMLDTALVDMYAKCGLLAEAQEVFDKLPFQDLVAWSVLIAGYAHYGHGEQALECYERMQCQGLSPDAVTFVCIVKACGSIGAAVRGQEIHAEIIRQGLLEKDYIVGSALVDMYAKCGLLTKSQKVFDKLPVRNVISWSALMVGYAQYGHGEQVLKCLEQMQLEGISPNAVTYACSLKACACVGAVDKGKGLHVEIVREGLLEKSIIVGTALVDMYAKCGVLEKAHEVFKELPVRNVVSWNAIIAGYSLLGKAQHVFQSFDEMVAEGIEPDLVTFTTLLNACSHAGLLEKGQIYFESMSMYYGLIPTLEQHNCMVDLFARAGHLDKAVAVIKEMPCAVDVTVWLTVLSACQRWGSIKVGRLAFEHAVQLDEKAAAAYITMRNIYAEAGRQEDANKVEAMRLQKQAWKKAGHCWWTDSSGVVHAFSVVDQKHPQRKTICAKLEYLAHRMSQEGYFPGVHWVAWNGCDGTKSDGLCDHSEKLAIAYALSCTLKGTPIHVFKYAQTCRECHTAISFVSLIEKRRIVVKDTKHFHIFEDGKCACGNIGDTGVMPLDIFS